MNEEKYKNVNRPLKEMLLYNLLGGIAWGIGVTIGASFLVSVLIYFLARIDFVPIIGDFAARVIEFIRQNNSSVIQ